MGMIRYRIKNDEIRMTNFARQCSRGYGCHPPLMRFARLVRLHLSLFTGRVSELTLKARLFKNPSLTQS